MNDNTVIQSRKYRLVLHNMDKMVLPNMKQYKLNTRDFRLLVQDLHSICYYCYSFGISEDRDSVLCAYLEFDSPIRYETLDNNLAFDSLTPVTGKREYHKEVIKNLCDKSGYVTVEFYEHESV